MEVKEEGEGEEGGYGTIRALVAIELLTHEAYPSGKTIIDARNGFNKISRLAILWTVKHLWPAGARFEFNCFRHWAQLIFRQPG